MENGGFKHLLRNGGFHSFLWTQFLGAFNDNLYKIIVSLHAISAANDGGYLALSGAVFVAPFLLFSGYAGRLADSIEKRSVLIAVKIFEIFVMGLGLAAFFTTRIEIMLVVLFLMALHSTVFSPAKYGIVPEMVEDRDLSRANALLEMSTFVAIVLGTAVGTLMFEFWKSAAWKMGIVTLLVAIAGFLTSLKITHVSSPRTTAPFLWNPFSEVLTGTSRLLKDRPMLLAVVGISYFWFLGAFFQLDLLLLGKEVLGVDSLHVGLMVTALAIGIGTGSMLAGRLSGDKVELGLVPLGSIFISLLCMLVPALKGSYGAFVSALTLLGLSGGLFIVPLNAYLQQRSAEREKGRIMATNNFYNTVGLLLASGALWLFHDRLHVPPDKLIFFSGLLTVLVTIYIVALVPDYMVRFILWLLTHTFFRVRISGQKNIPLHGPALLVANHVSHVDGFLIGSCVQRFIRFMVWRPIYEMKVFHWFMRLSHAIPVGSGAQDRADSIRRARHELEAGHVVCIFAEGAITRTGNMLPFKRGLERILDGLDVPVIPVHLDGVWGSIFSFERGRFFWKMPKKIPYPVHVSFGAPMPSCSTSHEVRSAVLELSSAAGIARKDDNDLLHLSLLRNARKHWRKQAMADSSGRTLTYGRSLAGSLLVAEWLRNNRPAEANIGLLLPSSVGGALANFGTMIGNRVPVNLNFTAGRDSMASACEQCGITTVITSKEFLAKAKLTRPEGAVFLEDILGQPTAGSKFMALLTARLAPAGLLLRRYGRRPGPDSIAHIVFSSGSTGAPKGVVLSHFNIISNIQSMTQVYRIGPGDCIVGVLPFFHSFGSTVTLWLPAVVGCSAAYHSNPTDAKTIGSLVQKHQGTFLLSTPTFCASYSRHCTREQFSTLRFALVGAEKLRPAVASAFREAFGLDLHEGYGCTEMSPVVAVNSPDFGAARETQLGTKPGTVGQPLPGIAVKVVDRTTLQPLPENHEGLLLVRGPNQMRGYLGQPSKTAEVVRDGWYVTGDIARIDDEGFIHITDRMSRFSKIGGEMVPHLRLEEAIYSIAPDCQCAVTGVPDDVRGERLVTLYSHATMAPEELWRALGKTDLPRLWLPKLENIYRVAALPVLGTGKVDLSAVKTLAEMSSRRSARTSGQETESAEHASAS
ncbi:MAG TPA: acyl-[ACP]--phospholipid O-acyltransferase [Candidatus Angelobacter sp.]|nr:acyl-[ACP]--phospholipid O-acyltransferase [Candidatus Angelobacter sp.]